MDSIFPIVIHHFDSLNFKNLQNELIECVYKEKKKNPKGTQKSNLGGWQSNNIGRDKNIIVEELFKSIIDYFQNNEIIIRDASIKVTNIWININGKGESNIKHKHPGADLSGVFWIKVPSGTFQIDSPHAYTYSNHCRFYQNSFRDSTNNHASFPIEPRDGTMLIFPSALYHAVEPSRSEEDRISASFNLHLL